MKQTLTDFWVQVYCAAGSSYKENLGTTCRVYRVEMRIVGYHCSAVS